MKSKHGSAALAVMFVVLFITGCGGGGGDSAPVAVPPPAPTGVTATAGDNSVSIAWSAVAGATSYSLYYSTTNPVPKATATKITGVTSPRVVNGLNNGETYYFVVTAVNAVGESADSTQVSATPALSPPAAPTNVSATAGPLEATISWSAVAGATSYNIYWSTTPGVTKATGNKLTGVVSPSIVTGLTNGTPYYFVVTAVNAAGEGVESSQTSATPIAAPPPTAPTNVTATAGPHEVTVSWTAVTGATSYNIYFDNTTPVTKASPNKVTGITASPRIVTGLANGKTYYFRVTAVNANGESDLSNEASAIPNPFPATPAPTGVSATAGPGAATVSWANVTGATSYNVYYSTTTGVTKATGTKVAGVTSPKTVTGLIRGTPVYFVVTAVNSDGVESVESSPDVSAIPDPPNPTFSQADLAGIWNIRVILGGTNPGWYSVTANVDSSGNVSVLNSGGTVPQPWNPDIPGLSITTGTGATLGVVTETGAGSNTTFHGKMSSGKNLIVGTSTQGTSFALHIFVKREPGITYSSADLENKTFGYHRIFTGASNFWEKATGSTNASRQITLASLEDSSGILGLPPSDYTALSVDGTGFVTIGNEPTFAGVMSSDKKIIVGTSTDAAGVYSIRIIQMRGQTYIQKDLFGTIVPHAFLSTSASSWAYATRDVDLTGFETFVTFLNSDGVTTFGPGFTVNIAPDGTISLPGNPVSHGGMLSFGKDLLVRIGDATGGSFIEITAQ